MAKDHADYVATILLTMKARFIAILFLCCTVAFAQQKLKKADRLFDEMAYVEAAQAYEDYFEKGAKNKPESTSLLNMADAYYFTRNYEKAAKWYSKTQLGDVHFNRYVQSLRIQKKYTEADRLTEQRFSNDARALQQYHALKHQLESSINKKPAFSITNLPSNSRLADFGTAFYGGKIVYASAKDTMGTGGRYYKYNKQPFLKLFVAERQPENGTLFGEVEFFPESQVNYHNATVAFADAETVYFSANMVKPGGRPDNDGNGTNNLQLLRGKISNGQLETQSLPFNSKEYSVAQPALSPDGKWLYFVSNMPGGYGETDIYKVEVKANGTFGPPQNLGPLINTPYKEMFPFEQDGILYFASEGHYGLGGLDIFKSTIIEDGFTELQNLGMPINSNRDDFALIISPDGSYGYFSSNRDGGRGDDDIYYFTKVKECEQKLSGFVVSKTSRQPINNAVVKALGKDGLELTSAKTDADGFYSFSMPCDAVVIVETSRENYTSQEKEIPKGNDPEVKIDFELIGYDDLVIKDNGVEKIAINPIYFHLDMYTITPQAETELDKVVYALKNFPEMIIKIESHTDSRASDEYNLTLSQNRAKATYDYIISKGIDPKRIESITGYGETKLLNNCDNDVPCTEEQHKLNRRSDFIVVRK